MPASAAILPETAATTTPVASVLVVAPGAPGISPAMQIAGVPLSRRIVLAARRAGFERVVVHHDGRSGPLSADLLAAADGTRAIPAERRRIVVLASDVVPQTRWLRELLATPIEPSTVYTDGRAMAMIDSREPGRVLAVVSHARSAADMIRALRREFPVHEHAFEPAGRFPLADRSDVPRAEAWLLRSLIKRNEGFMSRYLERRVSLAITRRLVATEITPNTMTAISLAVGFCAAPFFLLGSPASQFVGALLFLMHSILDGCDGELARLKFLESRAGALLDFWGDNAVHAAIFGCIAIGWSLQAHALWPLLVGVTSVGSTLGAAAAVSRRTIADASPLAQGTLMGRLTRALANRDFIYVVIILSARGKAYWFLVLSAIGTPLFLLLVLVDRFRGEAAPGE